MSVRRLLLGALAALGIGLALVAGITVAAFLNSQTTSANLSMVTSDDFTLYICEPGGIAGPACGAAPANDDSAGDEIIFETDENAAPGSTRTWDIRLKNTGTSVAWDIFPYSAQITPVDPQEDCTAAPYLIPTAPYDQAIRGVMILGKVDPAGEYDDSTTGLRYAVGNDNHGPNQVPGATLIVGPWGWYGGTSFYVHVEPGDYEDLRITMAFPDDPNQAAQCVGSQWNLDLVWNVGAHQ